MQARLKTLEKLVLEACARVRKLESENQTLKLEVKGLSRELERLQAAAGELRQLRDWRESARVRLRKISLKIEKALERANR